MANRKKQFNPAGFMGFFGLFGLFGFENPAYFSFFSFFSFFALFTLPVKQTAERDETGAQENTGDQ